MGLLTPPEMARKAGQICYSMPNVPVLVDADTGALQAHFRQWLVAPSLLAVATDFSAPACDSPSLDDPPAVLFAFLST